jgi:hypothetical protein
MDSFVGKYERTSAEKYDVFLKAFDVNILLRKGGHQVVTMRSRLSLLTNSALALRVQMRGEGGVARSQPMSTAVHIT